MMTGIKIRRKEIMKKYTFFAVVSLMLAACTKEAEIVIPVETSEIHTFNVVIEPDTKVSFGTPEGGSIALNWKDGDEVGFRLEKSDDSKVIRKGTVSIDGDNITVSLNLASAKNGYESILDVWYPYNEGVKPASIPAAQTYDVVFVPVQMSTKTSTTITFATYLEYVVLEFPITQTAHIIADYAHREDYFPISKRINQICVTASGDTYTLNTSTNPAVDLKTLKDELVDNRATVSGSYYLVIRPLVSEDITVTYTTEDNVTWSNSKSSLTLPSKSYRKMPVLDMTGYHFWNFGLSHTNNDPNGLAYWFREVQSPMAAHSMGIDYMTTQDDSFTIIPDTADNLTYSYYITPLWGGGSLDYRFCSNGSTLLSNNTARITLSQKYPILAVATDRPKAKADVKQVDMHIFDPNASGNFKSRTIWDENSSIHSTAMVYARMSEADNILASSAVVDAPRVQMKLIITYNSKPTDPNLKVYFAGTFRSEAEAKAYYNSYFGY